MSYAISEENLERQRLLARILAPVTNRLLQSLPLGRVRRCLDLGCGIGETTRLLASALPECALIGIEQNPDLVEAAGSIGTGEGSRISFQEGRAEQLDFGDATFDFVYARYLLHHLEDPKAVLSEMLRVARPGGIVAVQEPDCEKQYCHPHSWAYDRIPEIYDHLFPNIFIGRRLHGIFKELGCPSPRLQVDTTAGTDVELRRSYRMVMEAIGGPLIERKILTPAQHHEICEELRRVEELPDAVCVWSPTFSVWVIRGQRAS